MDEVVIIAATAHVHRPAVVDYIEGRTPKGKTALVRIQRAIEEIGLDNLHLAILAKDEKRQKDIIDVSADCDAVRAFWLNVAQKGIGDCWLWLGARNPKKNGNYGFFAYQAGRYPAHRFSWLSQNRDSLIRSDCSPRERLEAAVRFSKRVVRHDCDNPPCVNPHHLRIGSVAANAQDASKRGRLQQVLFKHQRDRLEVLIAAGKTTQECAKELNVREHLVAPFTKDRQ